MFCHLRKNKQNICTFESLLIDVDETRCFDRPICSFTLPVFCLAQSIDVLWCFRIICLNRHFIEYVFCMFYDISFIGLLPFTNLMCLLISTISVTNTILSVPANLTTCIGMGIL